MEQYEVHVTCQTNQIERFREVCGFIDVKPIVIELQNKLGDAILTDVMTSSKYTGDDVTGYVENICDQLRPYGFTIVRKKIEVPPWHPSVPTLHNQMDTNGFGYFESHIRVKLHNDAIKSLRELCDVMGVHVSRNIFKKLENDFCYMMRTARLYDSHYENFKCAVDQYLKTLDENGFVYDKCEIEYVIFDSKIDHDKCWVES